MKTKLYFYIFLLFIYCIRFEESPDDPSTLQGALKHSFLYNLKKMEDLTLSQGDNQGNSYTPDYTPDKIILYVAKHGDGNMDIDKDGNARNDVDNICRSFLPSSYQYMSNVKGFISISVQDQISDFPSLYNVPIDLPILGPDPNNPNRLVANNWADLWNDDGNGYIIRNTLQNAIGLTDYWWSGSNVYGEIASENCNNWTSNSSTEGSGRNGSYDKLDSFWIFTAAPYCDVPFYLLCIAW